MGKYNEKIKEILRSGGVGVLPTDTIYGIVGSALNKKTVERIYKLRKRNLRKPMIVLIGSMPDLKIFGAKTNPAMLKILSKAWPHLRQGYGGQAGKVSVILSLKDRKQKTKDKWKYLHRGTNTIAFRLPTKKLLGNLLAETGPLVAPSANPEGKPPARTIKEAKRYFKNKVDFYLDGGMRAGKPSRLIKIEDNKVILLRR